MNNKTTLLVFSALIFSGYLNADYKIHPNSQKVINLPETTKSSEFSSCKDILDNSQANTDNGGWTLVLNYSHAANTTPNTLVLNDRLPLLGSNNLGTDESSSSISWGHISNALFSSLSPNEIRFQCESSGHSRKLDFKTQNTALLNYFSTGTGGLGTTPSFNDYTTLPNHNANLPATTQYGRVNFGNDAMINFPFYNSGLHHWGIGIDANSPNRWECDDHPDGPGFSTIHKIWIR